MVSEWTKAVGAITLFVADLERSKAFYGTTFDLPVLFEDDDSVVFQFADTLINLLSATAAVSLVAPRTVGQAGTSPTCQFTIWVDDADAVVADLQARGVGLVNGPMDREWGHRTATFADPDGHLWEIAQNLESGG